VSRPPRAPGYTSSAGPGYDTHGLVQIPIQPIDPSVDAPGDPALNVLLSYLQAFLVKDQNAEIAWRVPGVDPAHPPVKETFTYDPQEYVFNAASVPCLYCWREDGSFAWMADDWDVTTDTLKLLWVFPMTGPIEAAIPSSSFVNGLVKAINIAIERGRTPSWQVAGDTDPVAPVQGSFLGTYLNAFALTLRSWRRTHVTERDDAEKVVGVYPAIEMRLELQETWAADSGTPAGTYETSEANGVAMTVENGAGTPMVAGNLAGTPVTD